MGQKVGILCVYKIVSKHYMRKSIFIISLILCVIFSCKDEKSEKKASSKKSIPEIVKKDTNPIFSDNNYELFINIPTENLINFLE